MFLVSVCLYVYNSLGMDVQSSPPAPIVASTDHDETDFLDNKVLQLKIDLLTALASRDIAKAINILQQSIYMYICIYVCMTSRRGRSYRGRSDLRGPPVAV